MLNKQEAKKITVIDDEKEFVDTVRDLLTGRGFDVTYAYGGLRGLEVVKEVLPDIVVLDINMPDLDGRDVLAKLKKDEETKDIPVIILSARSDQFDESLGRELGAADYITKPYSSQDLIKKINSILNL